MDQLSVAKMVMKTTASGEWSCGVKVALNARGITVEAARLFTQDQLIAERKCVINVTVLHLPGVGRVLYLFCAGRSFVLSGVWVRDCNEAVRIIYGNPGALLPKTEGCSNVSISYEVCIRS